MHQFRQMKLNVQHSSSVSYRFIQGNNKSARSKIERWLLRKNSERYCYLNRKFEKLKGQTEAERKGRKSCSEVCGRRTSTKIGLQKTLLLHSPQLQPGQTSLSCVEDSLKLNFGKDTHPRLSLKRM